MTARVTIDFETRSYANLKDIGAWNYSTDPTTDIICLCWKFEGDAEVGEWSPLLGHAEMPADLRAAIESGCVVEAHNYAFEFAVWQNVAVAKHGFCPIGAHQWRCSMAVACYYALPAALDALCRALGMPAKDPRGKRLISMYSCMYLPSSKKEIPAEHLREFIDYCKTDVLIEEAVSDYLGDLPDRELPVFQLDQTINLRGLNLDIEGIFAASAVVDARAEELKARFVEITGLNPTQGDKLKTWALGQGTKLETMQADYLEGLLEDDGTLEAGLKMSPAVREMLRIRLKINKASTKKLDAMARHRSNNGRALWQSRYHGAGTGRWTGSGFQPLNLVRSWEGVDDNDTNELAERLCRDIKYRDPKWLDMLYGDAMEAVSKAGRHWIRAAPDHRIMAADFVSIEAVILACLAGEQWKIDAFRDGKKIYELMGDKIYGLPEGTVTKKTHPTERQDGKTGELAFGYQGALNAWLNFDDSGRHTDDRIIEICKAWRSEHPMIVAFWRGLEEAAIDAVANPGKSTSYREIGFEIVDEWLSLVLPNGKRLWYREPTLKMGMPQWHKPDVEYIETKGHYEQGDMWIPATRERNPCFDGTCRCRPQPKLSYMAQKEGAWKRVHTYGGKLAENATQAASREFLIPSIVAAEKAGYPVILTVYDEIVAEVPNGHGSLKEFNDLLKHAPGREWAASWPIGVDGWEGQRYRK